MPQMSPMLWLVLLNFSLINLMLVLITVYFYWTPFTLMNFMKIKYNYKFKLKW
uniref:ATP synthase F0 subunit 8 n=1 Tax=Ceratobaeus sp. MM-2013 TaxID=1429432 RepID=A0A067YFY4_9HYME|nr:ATP synthase F0 subunit 8 [Ceratobaeus sp. MM-2013]